MQKNEQTLSEIHKLAADFYHDSCSKLFTLRNTGRTLHNALPKLLACYQEAVAQGKAAPLGRNEHLGLELARDGLTTAAQKLSDLHKEFWVSLDGMIPADSIVSGLGNLAEPPLKPATTAASAATSIEPGPVGQASHRILFADDEPTYQLVFRETLRDHGCQVDTVGDGLQALQLIEQNHFDLILLDVRMPNLNGFETTTRIRRLEENHSRDCTPIIGISDSPLEEDRQRGLAAGMDEFITKTQAYEGIAELLQRYPVRSPGGTTTETI